MGGEAPLMLLPTPASQAPCGGRNNQGQQQQVDPSFLTSPPKNRNRSRIGRGSGQGRGENMQLSTEGKGRGEKIFTCLRNLRKVPCCCSCAVKCPVWGREAGFQGAATPAVQVTGPAPPFLKSWIHPFFYIS